MATLAALHRAVESTLASKRLGQPVFVRYHLHGLLAAESADVNEGLAKAADTIGGWFRLAPSRLVALPSGDAAKGQTALALQFASGATALLSETHGAGTPPGAMLMVLGSKGSLIHSFDAATTHAWENPQASLEKEKLPELLDALQVARKQQGEPVDIRQPGTPEKTPPAVPPKVEAKYGVLLVTGSHTHQENYAAAFAADPRCKLVALTDEPDVDRRRRQLNERLARELGIPYEPELAKALKRDDVQIVSICAEPERRGRIAVLCAKAGKHLYLDKSLAAQLSEADALRDAVRQAKVKSHMFSFVSTPWAAEAKRWVTSGKLGKLLAIHADAFFAKGRPGTAKLGTPRKEEYPPRRHQLIEAKREFDNVGVYPITLIAWLTGQPFRTVHGVTANYFFKEHQQNDVEDFGLLAGTLADGLPVTIAAGRCGWTSHPAGGVNQLLLVGSERTVLIDANRPRVEVAADETPWTPPNVNPEDPMGFWTSTQAAVHLRPKQAWIPLPPAPRSDAAYFVDRLDTGQDSEVSVAEAAHAAEVLHATYLSASRGETVKLPLARA